MILINIKGERFLSLLSFISKSVLERRGQKENRKDICAPKGVHSGLLQNRASPGDFKDSDDKWEQWLISCTIPET